MSFKALMVIAAVVLGVGALIGLIPVTSQGVNCGSAFVRSSDAFNADFGDAMRADAAGVRLSDLSPVESACTDLRSVIRIPAIALLAVGGVVFLAGNVINMRRQEKAKTS